MANATHLSLIKRGVNVWNRWRQQHFMETPDLSGADLTGFNFRGANLINANLSRTNLSLTDLTGAFLSCADLRDAFLSEANLPQANLCKADLTKADLSFAQLSQATLIEAILTKAILIEASLDQAMLNYADLSEANLTQANLCDANAIKANLTQTKLNYARLKGTNLSKAFVSEASLKGANLRAANLSQADFSFSDLLSANLSTANLSKIILIEAHLRGANLRGANLKAGRCNRANLSRVDLSEADLRGANLTQVDLSEADLSQTNVGQGNLTGADLTSSKLHMTDLSATTLTAACLEEVHLDDVINVDQIVCDHLYLRRNQQQRHPQVGKFMAGELIEVFQSARETLEFLLPKYVDWAAFAYALKQMRSKNEGLPLRIQRLENKSDGTVLVSLSTAVNANKAQLHQEIWQIYEDIRTPGDPGNRVDPQEISLLKQLHPQQYDYQNSINRLFDLLHLATAPQPSNRAICSDGFVWRLGQLIYTSFPTIGFTRISSPGIPKKIQHAFEKLVVGQYWNSYEPPQPEYRAAYLHQITAEQLLFGWLYNDGRDDLGRPHTPYFICYYFAGPFQTAQLEQVFTCLQKGPVALIDRQSSLPDLNPIVDLNVNHYQPVRFGVTIPSRIRVQSLKAFRDGRLINFFIPADGLTIQADPDGSSNITELFAENLTA